jgi:hypothetical protein
MNGTYTDLTGEIADLNMYSYERAANIYWNAFANRLIQRGYTQSEAMEILRWMLDDADDKVELLAKRMCDVYVEKNKKDINAMLKEETA